MITLRYSAVRISAVLGLLAAVSGLAQNNLNFDSGTFNGPGASTINYNPSFGGISLGGAGKAAFFDTPLGTPAGLSSGSGWTLDSPVGGGTANTENYGYWFQNTGTPDTTNRYVWLGGNEACMRNSCVFTNAVQYKISVRLAGWRGTLTDNTGGLGLSHKITTNRIALEVPAGWSVAADPTSQLQDALFKAIKRLRSKGMIDFAGQPSRSFPHSPDG